MKTITCNYPQIEDDDLLAHIEDDLYTVNVIRGGKLVSVREQDLTSDERRAAHNAMFNSCAIA